VKILNLYAGIGGNRRLWGDEHEITAVEYKQDIADVYQQLFPNDTVIVAEWPNAVVDVDFHPDIVVCLRHVDEGREIEIVFKNN
jgi:tRNA A37 threonylcarbamoyladenosine biosynthesis protein TsaE